MQPIENVIREISGEKYATASLIIPIVHCMEVAINKINLSTLFAIEFHQKLIAEIERRFKDVEYQEILAISTILDPRFKHIHFCNTLAMSSARHTY